MCSLFIGSLLCVDRHEIARPQSWLLLFSDTFLEVSFLDNLSSNERFCTNKTFTAAYYKIRL